MPIVCSHDYSAVSTLPFYRHRAADRLCSGIFHAYLHLGFAFEYNQPAVIAEGLAMAAVHDPDANKIAPIYLEAEKLASASGRPGKMSLREIMEELRASNNVRAVIDGNDKIDRSKNVADNAMQKIIQYASKYSLSDSQLEDKVNEQINTCCKHSVLLIST